MSRNGQGTYVLPSGNPVITGTVITSTWANTTLSDVATALTGSIASDGQTVVTGNLQLGNNRITGMADGIAPNDAATVLQTTNANIVSGSINGTVIGGVVPANGTFTNLTATLSATVPTVATADKTTKAASTAFVHNLFETGGNLTIVLAFGVSKTPAQLPANGLIPANWDSTGNPIQQIQFRNGDIAIYNLCAPSATDYNDCFSFSLPTGASTGQWVNIGPVEGPVGPVGPQGPQGAQGIQGPKGDTGANGIQGPKGDTGNDGPQGIAGPQGPIGPQGDQGPAGEPAVLVGSFGASKTPADLPVNGFIPANWDSPGNPPTDEQLTVGQALVYSDCPPNTPLYGHVFSYVGTGFDANGWIDCGDIVGPQGPTGPQGIQGPQGNNGTDGQQGPQGPQGPQGVKGDTGAQGPQGPAGSDATVTGPAVISALGYTPASNDGTNVSGTWGINISGNSTSCSGNSATATLASNATNATNATYAVTQPQGTNNTTIATTAFVAGSVASGVPSGVIVMWSGATNNVPAGWLLCNGESGTPNLQDRFVIGAGNAYAVNAQGGSANAIVVSHSHGVNDPSHQHTSPGWANTGYQGGGSITCNNNGSSQWTSNLAATGITIQSAGQDGTNANLPPYWALAYIMKT